MTTWSLVCDIGGTHVKAGYFNGQDLEALPSLVTPADWQTLQMALHHWVQASPYPLAGVGFSVPGTVDLARGVIGGISAVPYIHHRPFVEQMSAYLGLPVSIENDANCAAVAELRLGAAREVAAAALIVLGSGVGGALILDGQLYRGRGGFAGEYGYGLVTRHQRVSPAMSPVNVARRAGYGQDFKALLAASDQGNIEAQGAVNQMVEDLATLIHNLYVALDLPLFLIGGAVSRREDFCQMLDQQVKVLLKESQVDHTPEVGPCAFQGQANLLGAGLLLAERLTPVA